MGIVTRMLIGLAAIATAMPVMAQEVIVTAQRRGVGNYDPAAGGIIPAQRPVINLRRSADFIVQPVWITGDTREAAKRIEELNATLRNAMGAAAKAGVELAIGDYVVEPLTAANYRDLRYGGDGRPDTSRGTFLVKVPVASGVTLEQAKERVTRFLAAVPKMGRTSLIAQGAPTLSVVNPDQYRGAIVDLIAVDATAQAKKFGPGYGVDVTGIDRPVEWARAGATEVFLYLPATYVVRKP